MAKSKTSTKIPIYDLSLAAFHLLNGNPPILETQGTRVIFCFNSDDVFYQLSARYNRNEPVPIIDFVNAQRQLKAMMLAKKGERRS